MKVIVSIGDKTLDLGPVAPGDTGKFVITIPAGVTQLRLTAHPLDNPLGLIERTIDLKGERKLFWDFDS